MKKTTLLALTLAGLAAAQSTDPGPSYCLGASHYPPETGYSFQCDSSGSIVFPAGQQIKQIEFYGAHIEVWTDTWTPEPGNAWGDLTVTEFTAPSGCNFKPNGCAISGSLAFNWSTVGSDGLMHTGTFSAAVNGLYDWRGWFHPALTNITAVVNN